MTPAANLHAQDQALASLELAQGQIQLIHDLVLACQNSQIELRATPLLHTLIAIEQSLDAAQSHVRRAFQGNEGGAAW